MIPSLANRKSGCSQPRAGLLTNDDEALEGGAIAAALPLGVEVVTEEVGAVLADEAIFEVLKCLLRLDPELKIGSGFVEDEAELLEEALEDEDVKGLRVAVGLQVGSGW